MAMLGERVTASTALRWGLVNEVLPDHEFRDHVYELLDGLAAGPTKSYAGTKRQLNAWLYAGLEEQLEVEAVIQHELAQSGDFLEGVTAFLQKRHPNFEGA
jgi:2-(1,2-epoxy-1,2-dihydrophenyl)acetyl-CoA isomerase